MCYYLQSTSTSIGPTQQQASGPWLDWTGQSRVWRPTRQTLALALRCRSPSSLFTFLPSCAKQSPPTTAAAAVASSPPLSSRRRWGPPPPCLSPPPRSTPPPSRTFWNHLEEEATAQAVAAAAAGGGGAMETLAQRAALLRESLQKSQSVTDAVVSILGSFDSRLSALDAAMRPIQVHLLSALLAPRPPPLPPRVLRRLIPSRLLF